jgi:NAD(P)-dependent dehydrogenase (short-subunit alcohol dehydrogenase family)
MARVAPSFTTTIWTPMTEQRLLKDLMSLSGRVALVTGGSGHIGRAFCETLAEQGASVVVLDRTHESCRAVAEGLTTRFGVAAFPLTVDLLQEGEVQSVCQRVVERFGRLDVLVNCAAYVGTTNLPGWVTDFAHQQSAPWRAALEVNLTVPFLLAQSCADALTASGHGSIINVLSIYGLVGPDLRLYDDTPMGNPAAYAASKGGLLQLTRWLATVLAPKIRVNAITPGGIERGQPGVFQERYVQRTPLARLGREEDMKGALAYLASDLSAYVTGQNIVVDGGWTCW